MWHLGKICTLAALHQTPLWRILHSHCDLPLGDVVDREEGHPGTAEHQHDEGQELGFTEGVRQADKESHSEETS